MADGILLATSITLIITYSFFVLGGCSPIHMRAVTALVGISCVILSALAGYGVSFYAGQYVSTMHSLLPFLMFGLGVDDMFVIVNSIDQAPSHLSADDRFRSGIAHAGPSITVTSITSGLSFFLGSISTIPAISSFCLFAGFCVVMLYFSFLTIFSPWFVEDLRRQHARKVDCCGLFCCKENSILCCRGALLTD